MPAKELIAGMARSYKNNNSMCQARMVLSDPVDNRTNVLYDTVVVLHVDSHDLGRE